MSENSAPPLPNMFPCLSYRDAPAAMDWLAKAFGFEKRLVVPGPGGSVTHAEMRFGPGVIMLGTVHGEDAPWGSAVALPAKAQSVYICLREVDAHYARAKAAGAEIVQEIQDTDYGARTYSARDPEGYVWHFGTYQPAA